MRARHPVAEAARADGAVNRRQSIARRFPATAAAVVDTVLHDAGHDGEDASSVARRGTSVMPAVPAGWTWWTKTSLSLSPQSVVRMRFIVCSTKPPSQFVITVVRRYMSM